MRKQHKNPKARQAAAKKLLSMALKKKAMTKGALAGNAGGTANKNKAPQDSMTMDSGNPGSDMK